MLLADPPTPSAARFDALFWTMSAICGVVALIVIVTMTVLVIRYRAASGRGDDQPIAHTTRFELAWTLACFGAFAGLFGFGVVAYRDLDPKALDTAEQLDDPLEILVTAKRWMWKFDHGEGGPREIGVVHVPAGRDVRLHMTSEDVIHSLFVPDFRLKRDLVPGRSSTLWFHAHEPGTHQLLCAEYCGRDHSRMRGEIVVVSPEDYASWRQDRAREAPDLSSGAALFRRHQCHTCHVDGGFGQRRAPALDGLYGSRERLADGREIRVDAPYLRESILEPGAALVEGWAANMPAYAGRISEAELNRLVLYIQTLDAPQEAR